MNYFDISIQWYIYKIKYNNSWMNILFLTYKAQENDNRSMSDPKYSLISPYIHIS